jgi:hypothetical protein
MTPVRLKKSAEELDGGTAGAPHASDGDDRRVVVCAACDHLVARVADRIEVAGREHHTCVNPAGFVYHIACYRHAPGCGGHGPFVPEHSWFAGYSWQIRTCLGCSTHLGWAFVSDDSSAAPFHGLIRDRVRERDQPGG